MKVKLKKMSLSPKEIEDGADEMSEDRTVAVEMRNLYVQCGAE